MSLPVPETIEEITPEWVTQALRESGAIQNATIIQIESRILGQNVGFLSVVAWLGLTYDQPEPDAPKAVVIKVIPKPGKHRELGEEMHAFQREILFYRDVAPQIDIRLPKMYYAASEPPNMTIIMEDLSYCRPGDQLKGMSLDLVLATAVIVGRLQAKFWNNDALEQLDWMPESDHFEKDYAANWDSMEEHFGHLIPEEGKELGRRMKEHIPWLFNEIEHRPRTIVHSDLREDNLIYDETGAITEVIILDWQLATRRMGVYDITRLMAASALPEQRRGHEIEILRAWHATLVAEGVTDYYWEEALYDMRLALLEFICFPVKFHKAFIGKTGRSAEIMKIILTRGFATAIDLQAHVAMPS
ncbi:oxidoreductase family protein [Cerasicoccus frondis]|uniref:oxidoreductase family protein n=1 Tax=Cerasicoccus frondis TaxID=490090 RepID=UPI0028527640|nr:oxidoreductase family protein [Cerasicoccus frondis]